MPPVGPGGKYERETIEAARATRAKLVVLMVLGGSRGTGFGVSVRADQAPLIADLPAILRAVADEIENEWRRRAQEDPEPEEPS